MLHALPDITNPFEVATPRPDEVDCDVCRSIMAVTVKCNFYWGSHGCSRRATKHAVHQCAMGTDACCDYDEDTHMVRHNQAEDGQPTEWSTWEPISAHGWYQ
jgi:hypothetical protein